MADLEINRRNSWSGALENWADEKIEGATAPVVVGLRALQGIASLLAVAETVMWVAFSVFMIPVSLCWCLAPGAVKSFDTMVLNRLAGSFAAIVTPWKRAIASCCCSGSQGGQVDAAVEESVSSGSVSTVGSNDPRYLDRHDDFDPAEDSEISL